MSRRAKQQVEEEEDDEDAQQRRKANEVTKIQRTIQKAQEEGAEDLQNIHSKQFDSVQKNLNSAEYFQRVNTTQAGTKDAAIITTMTSALAKQVKTIGTSNSRVSCSKLAETLHQQRPNGSNKQIDFNSLGRDCRVFFPTVPTWDCMLGAMEISLVAKKTRANVEGDAATVKKRATKVVHQVETLGVLSSTQPKKQPRVDGEEEEEVSHAKAEANQFEHHADLQRELNKTLQRHKNDNVEVFDTVVNPKSFTQTVENIFALSFLVKDGKAAIKLDEEHKPIVHPEKGKSTQTEEKTFVMAFSYEDWKNISEERQTALLPHRAHKLYENTT